MGPLIRLVAQRLALGLLVLFIVSIIIAAAVDALPGDVCQEMQGQGATAETLAACRAQIGLDRSLPVRYVDWLSGIARGDFGVSLANGRPISNLIGTRIGNTFFLAGLAAAISVPLALTLGILAALYRNGYYDRTINVVTLSSISFPEFFIAYILILYLSVTWGWFPSLSNIGPDISLADRAYRSLLPALTLTLVVMAHMMRMTRASIINLLASPYIEMANLKGVSRRRVILRHALPNAWAPIVNVVVLNLAYLIVGVVVVEVVFVYPGLGELMVDSVRKRDIPVVQACAAIFAATYIILNMTADILSIVTNPRLLHPR